MAGVIQERMKKQQDSTVSDNIVLRILSNIELGNHGILSTFSKHIKHAKLLVPGQHYCKGNSGARI